MRLHLIAICVLLLTIPLASCDPEITEWNNSITSDDSLSFSLTNGVTATFNVITVSESVSNYNWWIDGSTVVNNNPTISKSWLNPFSHNVTVEAVTANGSVYLTWNPIVQRATAITTTETINETPYNDMMSSITDEDYEGFFSAITLSYIYAIGQMFFVVIIGLYYAMAWQNQESIIVPASVGLILGIVLFAFLPETFYVGALSLVLLSASAMIYNLYKER